MSTTDNSMNIHNVKSIETETDELITDSGNAFTLTRTVFTDTEGNVFTVNAFRGE